MNSKQVICRVKALYPYESNDPSSLSFKADALIEVFSQLESGWWDGWCEGRRGWFPSNYVEILPEDQNSRRGPQRVIDRDIQKQSRLSLHVADMLIQPSWVLQTTEDGSEQYYYHLQTQEMRYSMPPDYYPEQQQYSPKEQQEPPVRPIRAANRGVTESFYKLRLDRAPSTTPPTTIKSSISIEFEDDKLPLNWTGKITPKSKNRTRIEEATVWDIDQIDPGAGSLSTSTLGSPIRSIYSHHENISKDDMIQDQLVTEEDMTLITWQTLSNSITQALLHLKDTAARQPHCLQESAAAVIHRIRTLLYVTNCLDKDTSPHLKDKQLRTYHRSLLAAAAKLALASKWPAEAKIQHDADDCLISMRNFITLAQDLHIDIKDKNPVLTTDTCPIHVKNTGLVLGKPETVAAIEMLAQQVREALRAYQHGLEDPSNLLVAQCRHLSNTTSQLLNVVQEISQTQDPRVPALLEAKSYMSSSMGGLFIVCQTMSEQATQDARVEECLQWFEKGIQQVVETVQKQVEWPLTPTTLSYDMEEEGSSTSDTWYLAPDENNDIVYTADGNVKGGSIHCLVQHLTQHDQLDSKFNTTFLLTYRSFCTTQELFNELFQRYQLTPPEGLKVAEVEVWKEKKLKLVRLRVFNVIKSWLETYYNEQEDRHMLPEITKFTDTVIAETMKFGAEQLSKLVKKRMLAEDSSQIRKMKLNVRTAEMPVPILPKNMKRLKLLELDPQELARQMTIMDFRLYHRIKPVECLDKNWGKPDTEGHHHIAANVKSSIEHSNQVTAWVTDSILSKDEVKKRAGVMKHWIHVAERCRFLNNFNTCMAILSAFDNGSIGRLKRTWELIGARTMQILQNIRRLMGANRNFSEYREIIRKVNPPCIPFLGIYLQDLTFIEDGNSNFLKKSDHLINFSKRMKTAEVIRDLQQYQSMHYMLQAVPDIQEFIQTHLHSSREEEELYNLSLRLEPRERGEDTIARRLKESGL